MSNEYYVLSKNVEGNDVYVGLTPKYGYLIVGDLEKAFHFFNYNSTIVWRKCNTDYVGFRALKVEIVNNEKILIEME